MRSDLVTIIKKEFRRFFGDRRLCFSTILLPGLLIYALYTILGGVLQNQLMPDEEYIPVIYTSNAPQSAKTILESLQYQFTEVDTASDDIVYIKEQIVNQQVDALLVFPDHFDEDVSTYNAITSTTPAPEIAIYYNSASTESEALYQTLVAVFDGYEATMSNKFDINLDPEVQYDLATKADTTAQVFSMMVPMLLIMMLMSGCMSVAPDAIAGEKERGTMATLLVTPAKRSSIALGKVISLATFALLSGVSSTLGVLLSLPKLMGGSGTELSADVYSGGDYVALIVVVLTTVLALISIFAIVSTFAKSIKEAGSYSSPIMILGIVLAVTSSLGNSEKALGLFTIPIYNSAIILNGIFSMKYTMAQVGITAGCNLLFTVICVYIMARMFNNEKIMFSR